MTDDLISDGFEFSYPLFVLYSTDHGPLAALMGPSGQGGNCVFLFTDSDLAESYSKQSSQTGKLSISTLANRQELLGFLAILHDAELCEYLEFDPVSKSGPRVMMLASKMIEILEPQVERDYPN